MTSDPSPNPFGKMHIGSFYGDPIPYLLSGKSEPLLKFHTINFFPHFFPPQVNWTSFCFFSFPHWVERLLFLCEFLPLTSSTKLWVFQLLSQTDLSLRISQMAGLAFRLDRSFQYFLFNDYSTIIANRCHLHRNSNPPNRLPWFSSSRWRMRPSPAACLKPLKQIASENK